MLLSCFLFMFKCFLFPLLVLLVSNLALHLLLFFCQYMFSVWHLFYFFTLSRKLFSAYTYSSLCQTFIKSLVLMFSSSSNTIFFATKSIVWPIYCLTKSIVYLRERPSILYLLLKLRHKINTLYLARYLKKLCILYIIYLPN